MAERELRTSELAKLLGVDPSLLRKWKARGLLKLGPGGVSGQGRSVECYWSNAAVEEARQLKASLRKTRPRLPLPGGGND